MKIKMTQKPAEGVVACSSVPVPWELDNTLGSLNPSRTSPADHTTPVPPKTQCDHPRSSAYFRLALGLLLMLTSTRSSTLPARLVLQATLAPYMSAWEPIGRLLALTSTTTSSTAVARLWMQHTLTQRVSVATMGPAVQSIRMSPRPDS